MKEIVEHSSYFGNVSFKAKEGTSITVTWSGEGLGEKKDFTSRLKVIDQTHYYGVAPWYRGIKRCKDMWHSYYLPCKDNVVKVVNSDGEVFTREGKV